MVKKSGFNFFHYQKIRFDKLSAFVLQDPVITIRSLTELILRALASGQAKCPEGTCHFWVLGWEGD